MKSITTKGFRGWKKFPGNTRTLYSSTNMSQPISTASARRRADPVVRCLHCSFEWHSWPSCWNSCISFEVAPLWKLTALLHWSLRAARVSQQVSLKDSSLGLQCHMWSLIKMLLSQSVWGWFVCSGLLAAKLNVAHDVTYRAAREKQSPGRAERSAANKHQ